MEKLLKKLMPIKDLAKRREYQRNLMAKKRLTENNVSLKEKRMLDPVRPCSRCERLQEIAEEFQEIATNLDFWLSKEEEENKRLTKENNRLEKKLKAYEKN